MPHSLPHSSFPGKERGGTLCRTTVFSDFLPPGQLLQPRSHPDGCRRCSMLRLSKRGTAQPWQPSQTLCKAPDAHCCHPGIPWLSSSLPLPWQRGRFPSVTGSPHLHGQGCRCLGNQGQKSGRQMSLLQEDTGSEALG